MTCLFPVSFTTLWPRRHKKASLTNQLMLSFCQRLALCRRFAWHSAGFWQRHLTLLADTRKGSFLLHNQFKCLSCSLIHVYASSAYVKHLFDLRDIFVCGRIYFSGNPLEYNVVFQKCYFGLLKLQGCLKNFICFLLKGKSRRHNQIVNKHSKNPGGKNKLTIIIRNIC